MESENKLTADQIIPKIGGFSKFQYISFFVGAFCLWGNSLYIFSIPFFMESPELLCKSEDGKFQPCEKTVDYICNHNIEYKYSADKYQNFITEFDLLCQPSVSAWLTAAIFLGALPGFIVFGFLGDTLGRIKMTLITGALAAIFLLLIMVLPANPTLVIIMTSLIGFATTGLSFTPFTFSFECIETKHVPLVGLLLNVAFAFNQIWAAFLHQSGITWRTQCLVIEIIMILLIFGVIFLRYDPPKYYISKQNFSKATESFKRIAKFNGYDWNDSWEIIIPESELTDLKKKEESGKVTELFTNSDLLKTHLLFIVELGAAGIMYYGITMGMPNLGGSSTINGLMNAGAEIVSYLAIGILLKKFGYFKCMNTGLSVAGILLLLMDFLDKFNANLYLKSILMYCAKFGVAMSYGILMISSDMLFPPKVRSTAVTTGFAVAGIGETLVTYLVGSGYKFAVDICYAFSGVFGPIAVFFQFVNRKNN